MSRRLEVLLHDLSVGQLTEGSDGSVEFRFFDEYRERVPRPILSQRFEDDLTRIWRARKGQLLPDFFANLVPEGRLRDVIEETTNLEIGDDLGLLAFVGQDLPGAVVVRPLLEASSSRPAAKPSLDREDETEKMGLRFSLAGVQLKFSMLREGEKLVLPARDEHGEWIVKLDSPTWPNLPENEFSMLSWARAAGFDVPECHLHDVTDIDGLPRRYAPAGSRALAIRRYDRDRGRRIHQEDLAQVVGLPPKKKYDQITHEIMARLVRRFIDEDAVGEMIRRLVFVIASGNNDAHLKNWSFIYPDPVKARWSPLYDQVATVAWEGPDRALALKLAGVKDFGRIDRSTFVRFAEKAQIDWPHVDREIVMTLQKLRRAWQEIVSDLPLPKRHVEALRDHWQRVPLLRGAGTL